MRLPDFLIIGAAKSGTTTLYQYLEKHPQVYLSSNKEPNFFGMDEHYAKGLEWYSSLFEGAKSSQICGEASTDYTKFPQFPESAERIYQVLPHIKLIYVMRHPVERAYSYYVHLGRGSKVKDKFEEHIKRTSVCLDGSQYMLQIDQYLKFFPKESFLFLLTNDLIEQPKQILGEVCRFLGIDDQIDLTGEKVIAANQANKYFEDTNRAKITKPLKAIPGLENAAKLLPQEWRDRVYRILKTTPYGEWVKKQYVPDPMSGDTRQLLLEEFRVPNQKLAEFLNRDLSQWSK